MERRDPIPAPVPDPHCISVSTPCPRAHWPAGQLTKSIPNSGVDCNGVVAGRIRFGLIIKGYSEGYSSSEITNAEHLSSGHLIEPKTA